MADLQEAINILLVAREVTPITDTDSGHPDVQAARAILTRHKRSVCSRKWWFNTERDVTLRPNYASNIPVPSGVIGLDEDSNYIIMDGKLYDPTERTNIFTEDVTGLTLIYNRDWTDLPIQAFDAICALAKEEFIRPLESRVLTPGSENDINRALATLQITDLRYKDVGKQAANPLMTRWQQRMVTR